MKKSLILIIFLANLFSFQFVLGDASTTDEIIVHQLVNNSCNENDLCEAHLNENFDTCPHDCHHGNINPAIIQAGLVAQDGLIEISNLLITFLNGIATISWETNKPTDASLILEDGMGGTEGGYLDELFMTHHTVKIYGLDPNEDYYFKIFAKGIYGDDNYETAQLYLITPTKEEIPAIIDEEVNPLEPDQVLLPPGLKSSSVYIIKAVDDDLNKGVKIVPPENNLPVKQKIISDFSGGPSLIKDVFNNVIDDTWFLQILIFLGIIIFIYLNGRR